MGNCIVWFAALVIDQPWILCVVVACDCWAIHASRPLNGSMAAHIVAKVAAVSVTSPPSVVVCVKL